MDNENPITDISIHAPHTGCDHRTASQARGRHRNFNPRTPYGVRLKAFEVLRDTAGISIHAPHTGCDAVDLLRSRSIIGFQSTHPIRGATFLLSSSVHASNISIHAPHTGCDRQSARLLRSQPYFNPRTPYGVRPLYVSAPPVFSHFNPRTPYGVRRQEEMTLGEGKKFQSTHPIRGATTRYKSQTAHHEAFQSTHPIRGATANLTILTR